MKLSGLVWRSHNPRWAFAPGAGDGAAVHGGRFNRVGVPTLYTSLRIETALLEAQQGFAFKAQPMTTCAYDLDCEDIADLTDLGVQASLGIHPADLGCAWEDMLDHGLAPPSWLVADTLINAGYAGILVRSFAFGATEADVNAVFWNWTEVPPHQVRVIDPLHRLPKDDSSWR